MFSDCQGVELANIRVLDKSVLSRAETVILANTSIKSLSDEDLHLMPNLKLLDLSNTKVCVKTEIPVIQNHCPSDSVPPSSTPRPPPFHWIIPPYETGDDDDEEDDYYDGDDDTDDEDEGNDPSTTNMAASSTRMSVSMTTTPQHAHVHRRVELNLEFEMLIGTIGSFLGVIGFTFTGIYCYRRCSCCCHRRQTHPTQSHEMVRVRSTSPSVIGNPNPSCSADVENISQSSEDLLFDQKAFDAKHKAYVQRKRGLKKLK